MKAAWCAVGVATEATVAQVYIQGKAFGGNGDSKLDTLAAARSRQSLGRSHFYCTKREILGAAGRGPEGKCLFVTLNARATMQGSYSGVIGGVANLFECNHRISVDLASA
jgi:hypothetical protein